MDRPPPLSLIQLGSEWIATNGVPAADGSIRFPEEDTAEEAFSGIGTPPLETSPSKPSAPPSTS
jgi:hypothetical protein